MTPDDATQRSWKGFTIGDRVVACITLHQVEPHLVSGRITEFNHNPWAELTIKITVESYPERPDYVGVSYWLRSDEIVPFLPMTRYGKASP